MTLPLFPAPADIPNLDMKMFRICNNAHKYWTYKRDFYALKTQLLHAHGHENGYDLQTIHVKCDGCNGTGWWQRDIGCNRCNHGIYDIRYVCLKRWLLNGELFHEPIGRTNENGKLFENDFQPNYTHQIKGLIKHEESELSTTFSFLVLLYLRDRPQFMTVLTEESKGLHSKAKDRFRNCMRIYTHRLEAIAKFLGIKKEDYYSVDELPF